MTVSWAALRAHACAHYELARDDDDDVIVVVLTPDVDQLVQLATVDAHGCTWLVLRADVAPEGTLAAFDAAHASGPIVPGGLVLDHGVYFVQHAALLRATSPAALDVLLAAVASEAVDTRARLAVSRADVRGTSAFTNYSE